jgi:putative Mg2+ transporter-C (MgtC) family protein
MGSALLMDLSIAITGPHGGDPGRIAAQVVTGIGFLGAGTILHTRGQITGLTSAATIWVVAALGMTIGAGHYVEAMGSSLTVVLVLMGLGRLEARFLSDLPPLPGAPSQDDWVPRSEGRRATDRRGVRREPTGEQATVRPPGDRRSGEA